MSRMKLTEALDNFETELNQQDEFEFFKTIVSTLKKDNPGYLEKLYNSLEDHKKKYMEDILSSKRVVLNEAKGKSQARKIVKPRARKVAANI